MNAQNALVVRRNCLDRSRSLPARTAPPSMMVMQQLVSALTKMNDKIDALALRQTQAPIIQQPPPIRVEIQPIVDDYDEPVYYKPRRTGCGIIREKLWEIFE